LRFVVAAMLLMVVVVGGVVHVFHGVVDFVVDAELGVFSAGGRGGRRRIV
jgi:hypothetical protein